MDPSAFSADGIELDELDSRVVNGVIAKLVEEGIAEDTIEFIKSEWLWKLCNSSPKYLDQMRAAAAAAEDELDLDAELAALCDLPVDEDGAGAGVAGRADAGNVVAPSSDVLDEPPVEPRAWRCPKVREPYLTAVGPDGLPAAEAEGLPEFPAMLIGSVTLAATPAAPAAHGADTRKRKLGADHRGRKKASEKRARQAVGLWTFHLEGAVLRATAPTVGKAAALTGGAIRTDRLTELVFGRVTIVFDWPGCEAARQRNLQLIAHDDWYSAISTHGQWEVSPAAGLAAVLSPSLLPPALDYDGFTAVGITPAGRRWAVAPPVVSKSLGATDAQLHAATERLAAAAAAATASSDAGCVSPPSPPNIALFDYPVFQRAVATAPNDVPALLSARWQPLALPFLLTAASAADPATCRNVDTYGSLVIAGVPGSAIALAYAVDKGSSCYVVFDPPLARSPERDVPAIRLDTVVYVFATRAAAVTAASDAASGTAELRANSTAHFPGNLLQFIPITAATLIGKSNAEESPFNITIMLGNSSEAVPVDQCTPWHAAEAVAYPFIGLTRGPSTGPLDGLVVGFAIVGPLSVPLTLWGRVRPADQPTEGQQAQQQTSVYLMGDFQQSDMSSPALPSVIFDGHLDRRGVLQCKIEVLALSDGDAEAQSSMPNPFDTFTADSAYATLCALPNTEIRVMSQWSTSVVPQPLLKRVGPDKVYKLDLKRTAKVMWNAHTDGTNMYVVHPQLTDITINDTGTIRILGAGVRHVAMTALTAVLRGIAWAQSIASGDTPKEAATREAAVEDANLVTHQTAVHWTTGITHSSSKLISLLRASESIITQSVALHGGKVVFLARPQVNWSPTESGTLARVDPGSKHDDEELAVELDDEEKGLFEDMQKAAKKGVTEGNAATGVAPAVATSTRKGAGPRLFTVTVNAHGNIDVKGRGSASLDDTRHLVLSSILPALLASAL